MKEILITSSVLILVILVLRRLFRNMISRREYETPDCLKNGNLAF